MLRRCETTITADGQQPGCQIQLVSAGTRVRFPLSTKTASRTRRTLNAGVARTGTDGIPQSRKGNAPGWTGPRSRPDTTRSKLEHFRCVHCCQGRLNDSPTSAIDLLGANCHEVSYSLHSGGKVVISDIYLLYPIVSGEIAQLPQAYARWHSGTRSPVK